MNSLLAVVLLMPLLLAAVAPLCLPSWLLRVLLPAVALPGVALVFVAPSDFSASAPWLLLGAEWSLQGPQKAFLLLTAALWALAGLYAGWYLEQRLRSFCVAWGLSLAGNLQLVLAADIVGFYTGFAVMSLASYVLVVHRRDQRARSAGAVYVAFAILGELLLLAGLLLGVQSGVGLAIKDFAPGLAALPDADWVVVLLWLGLGVKAAVPLFHLWLPLAHPVAPTPASAVLSAAMVKAGVLGWLLLLPLGHMSFPTLGLLIAVCGASGAWLALIPGVCQRDAKAVLAYSSVSQLGMLGIMVGAALMAPAQAGVLSAIVALYAAHHAFAKGALFLATGLGWAQHSGRRWLVCAAVLVPALALMGLSATSGWWMKAGVKQVLAQVPHADWLVPLFSGSALVTALLMLRFSYVLWPALCKQRSDARLLVVTLGTSLLAYPALLWLVASGLEQGLNLPAMQPAWLDGLAVLGLAMLLAVLAWRLRVPVPPIPPGDLIALLPQWWRAQSTK